jgi:hypothetical protein
MRTFLTGLVCLPLCWFLAGCAKGHSTATVSGIVTYRGQPLTTGKIAFIDPEGHAGSGPIEDGRYSVQAPVGECKVGIESREPDPVEETKTAKQGRPGMLIGKSWIPEKYASPHNSGLTFKVENGDNQKDFNLKD